MKRGKRIWIGLCVVALMASCDTSTVKEQENNTQNSSEMQQTSNENTTKEAVADKEETLEATDTVLISGMKFNPEELHVKKGATVIWINQGIVPHDVTDFPDKKWTSDTIKVDQSWTKTIDKSFDYFCSIHIAMKEKIIVDK